MLAFLCLLPLGTFLIWAIATMEDYERTINQGYPAGQEVKVNFWTRKLKK